MHVKEADHARVWQRLRRSNITITINIIIVKSQMATATPVLAGAKTPSVNTYHCICTNLVLATTLALPALPRRAKPCLDSAYILPRPSAHLTAAELDVDDFDADEIQAGGQGLTFLLSLNTDTPIMIRGDEGFEKRWPLRCGRCKLVVGYQLDSGQFGHEAGKATTGREDGVIYLLPGSVVTTAEMKDGKVPFEVS